MRHLLLVVLVLAVLLSAVSAFAQAGGTGAGAVPNGADVAGEPLRLTKDPASGGVTLTWGASCSRSDTDYAVYEGLLFELVTDQLELTSFDNHVPRTCSTGAGATFSTFQPDPRPTYYLVVPHDQAVEGSYGRRSDGTGRSRGPASCYPQSIGCGAVPDNDPPIAVPDQTVVFIGGPTPIDVLSNDVDLDHSPAPLAVTDVTQPTFGAVSILPTGQVQFSPDSGFVGLETFSYTVSDGTDSDTADVSVEITFPQPPPTAALSVVPAVPQPGDPVMVSWSSSDGTEATLNGAPVPLSGSLVLNPIMTTTYELVVTGLPGTDPASSIATVTLPECTTFPTPVPTLPPCPVWCGTGLIDSLSSAPSLNLATEDMIHVLILTEGYTQLEFDDGTYDDDIDGWLEDWQSIDTFVDIKEAFCIWEMPLVSSRHIERGVPDPSDTALEIPIKEDSDSMDSIPSDGPTAATVWNAAAIHPYPPTSFYPTGGRTKFMAKNLMPVVMLHQPGGKGWGGKAGALRNPNDDEQRLVTAFGKRWVHEFSHALSRLRDEYIEDDDEGPPGCEDNAATNTSAGVTNVVCDADCATVPWAHLLEGGAINPNTSNLVGAFGHPVEGFHSEAKCLMNGGHDNADYFGGDGKLREDRLCNFCRELTMFRLFERVHVLDDAATSWPTWIASYRDPFFDTYPFDVPVPVPRKNSDGEALFPDCPGCGDGIINVSEVCDGDDFGGLTCADYGFEMGDLACIADCNGISAAGCSGGVSNIPPASYGSGCLNAQQLEQCEQLGPGGCALQFGHLDCLGGPCRRTNEQDRDVSLDDPFNLASEFHPDGNYRDEDDNLYYCANDGEQRVCADVQGWGVCRRCDPTDGELNTRLGCPCNEEDPCESFNASDPVMECFGEESGGGPGFCWDTPPSWRCAEGLCGMAPRYAQDDVMYCEYYAQQASCQPFFNCGGGGIEAITCSDQNLICDGNDGCTPECLGNADCAQALGWPANYCCGNDDHCQPC